ncbi:Disease resistance-responsive dirigent-like family protein [Prunus dulcis]|nr:Disease resistance-responsive dirigent-like family protein [Prunus dulcis]
MFGTLTVFDDELTEGHELGSGLLGKAQGFYVASSEDGSSQTIAFTAMFQSGGYADSLTFFGGGIRVSSCSHGRHRKVSQCKGLCSGQGHSCYKSA